MRDEPTPRATSGGDHAERQREGGDVPVRLDLLVRRFMAACRARLAVEDAARRAGTLERMVREPGRDRAAPGRRPGASMVPPTQPTILVYHGERLAAVFVCGAPPVYHGTAGERVLVLVEVDRPRYNPWALEVRASGLYHDTAHWFLASVLLGRGPTRGEGRMRGRA